LKVSWPVKIGRIQVFGIAEMLVRVGVTDASESAILTVQR